VPASSSTGGLRSRLPAASSSLRTSSRKLSASTRSTVARRVRRRAVPVPADHEGGAVSVRTARNCHTRRHQRPPLVRAERGEETRLGSCRSRRRGTLPPDGLRTCRSSGTAQKPANEPRGRAPAVLRRPRPSALRRKRASPEGLCTREGSPYWTADRAQPSTVPFVHVLCPPVIATRAHSVPVRADNHGRQRCDRTRTTTRAHGICARQSHMDRPSAVASQAESASLILVTRSM